MSIIIRLNHSYWYRSFFQLKKSIKVLWFYCDGAAEPQCDQQVELCHSHVWHNERSWLWFYISYRNRKSGSGRVSSVKLWTQLFFTRNVNMMKICTWRRTVLLYSFIIINRSFNVLGSTISFTAEWTMMWPGVDLWMVFFLMESGVDSSECYSMKHKQIFYSCSFHVNLLWLMTHGSASLLTLVLSLMGNRKWLMLSRFTHRGGNTGRRSHSELIYGDSVMLTACSVLDRSTDPSRGWVLSF